LGILWTPVFSQIRYLVDLEAIEMEQEKRRRRREERVEEAIAGTSHLEQGLKWQERSEEERRDVFDR